MSIRKIKPTNNAQRAQSVASFAELTKGAKAPKALIMTKKNSGGRNAQGVLLLLRKSHNSLTFNAIQKTIY